MFIQSLRLHDFRSYHQVLLEAVHLCCLGRSHRTAFDREMIRAGQETAAVQVRVQRADGVDEVGVRLYSPLQKKRKLLYINGKTAARTGELMGHVTCVMFSPEDLDIVRGAPQGRRRFVDMLLSQCGAGYYYALQTYNSALKQRNALLHDLARGGNPAQLDAWDEQLAAAAAPVVRARQYAAQNLSTLSRGHYAYISGRENEPFSLRYAGCLAESAQPSEDLLRLLQRSRAEDIRRMTSTVGPHRDDLALSLCGQDMRAFASQGQMRTAVLSLRLAELDMLTERQHEAPLLLLDDVLSERDVGRRARLLERIRGVQTLLTCTDLSDLTGASPQAVLRVHNGEILSELYNWRSA